MLLHHAFTIEIFDNKDKLHPEKRTNKKQNTTTQPQ